MLLAGGEEHHLVGVPFQVRLLAAVAEEHLGGTLVTGQLGALLHLCDGLLDGRDVRGVALLVHQEGGGELELAADFRLAGVVRLHLGREQVREGQAHVVKPDDAGLGNCLFRIHAVGYLLLL